MGREHFLFLPFPLPCGSALWDPDLSGPLHCPYSPECVEGEFCEVRLGALPRRDDTRLMPWYYIL
jgi:hypothetical protein